VRIRPKRKVTSAEVAYALGRAEALREAHRLAAVWEAKGANAGAVRIVLMGQAANAWDEYHLLTPLEAAEEATPCLPQPASSAASSGLSVCSGTLPAAGKVAERVQPAQIIQLEDRRVGWSVKVPPA
jgi:hypothetical protein